MRILLLATGVLLAASPALAKDVNETFEKQFQVSSQTSLRLDHGDGDLLLIPWEKDHIDVRIVYRGEVNKWGLGNYDADFSVHYEVENGEIHIRAQETGGGVVIGAVSHDVEEFSFTVKAPAWVPVRASGDDGDVEVNDWVGDLHIRLDDGDITGSEIRGTMDIHCEDGDIRINGFDGLLDIRSDDGEVRLDRGQGECSIELEDGDIEINDFEGDLIAITDDGDIEAYELRVDRLRLRSEDGDITIDPLGGSLTQAEVRAQDGRISIAMDPNASFEFLASTDDGYLDVELPASREVKSKRDRISGLAGSGQGKLRVHSESGRIRLR